MATRRTTLGAVSSQTLNSRLSLGNAQHGPMKDRRMTSIPGQIRRQSMSRRQSSIGGRKSSLGRRMSTAPRAAMKMSDPRPLDSKAFMSACQGRIIKFITERGYNQPIGPKMLISPSLNEFKNLFQFLIHMIDPAYAFDKGRKFEDDVILWFKQLKYPFQIPKSSLQAVGTMHAWTQLLAALNWIVEVLLADEAATGNAQTPFDLSDESSRILFNLTKESYQLFLFSGDNNLADVVSQELEKRNATISEEILQLEEKVQATQLELQQLTANELQAKRKAFEDDRPRFIQYNEANQLHIQKTEERIQALQQTLQEAQQDLQNAQAEAARLRQIVEGQELSAADIQRMTHEREQLSFQLKQTSKLKEAAEENVYQAEVSVAKKIEEVERSLSQYNQLATNLHLLPASAKNAGGFNYELTMNLHAKSGGAILSQDVKGVIRPQLQKFKDLIFKKTQQALEEEITMQEKVQRSQDALTEKHDQINGLNSKLKKLEARLNMEKLESEEQIQQITKETDEYEARLMQMRTANSTSVADSESELRAAIAEYEQVQAQIAREREAAVKSVMSALSAAADHKELIAAQLAEAETHAQGVLDQVTALVPSPSV